MTSALTLAERFGRALMMDFGFGSFLEKVEENFGKFVLRVLLVLIGLAVAVFCMRVIWVNAISPALDLMGAMGVWKWLASVAVAGA
jgi:hypothetical protein